MLANELTLPHSRATAWKYIERGALGLIFIAIGTLINLVFSPFRPILGRTEDYLGRILMIAGLLVIATLVRKSESFRQYYPIFLGLLIMAVTVTLDRITGVYLLEYLHVDGSTPDGYAVLKLNQCLIILVSVISLTLFSGGSLGSIYLQKGNLKLGLVIGLALFFLAAVGSPWMATQMFMAHDLSQARILNWLPWVLLFVLANALEEELLFRGLFLRKLQPFFGMFFSNFLIFFIFTALHYFVNYTSDNLGFVAVLFPLAMAWGYLMQKTNSLWGSVLFHAGMDIPIALGIFSNL